MRALEIFDRTIGKPVLQGSIASASIGGVRTIRLSPEPIPMPGQYARLRKHAENILRAVAQAAQAAGVACEMVQVEHEHPYQAIIDTTESKVCDLIVMASHGRRGISAIVLGSETFKVLGTGPSMMSRAG
jgi:nucleotide-binding universal stress UspA family protein